ncbi:MAG: hypothetical protein M1834_006785 [Cirrosporium novae-zelandiae]|nr:MAG: hypothetical protein M1834_006785 [Cirrosporium novae-zelandiae]
MEVKAELRGEAKLKEVSRLIELLKEDFIEKKLLPPDRNALLEQVKVFSRSPDNADHQGIETLCKHGFDGNSLITSREALRCLANAFLLDSNTRQFFVDLGYPEKAAERLKVYTMAQIPHGKRTNDNRDDEFLISRILFLMTYGTTLDFDNLIELHQLADSINNNIARHAKNWPRVCSRSQPPQMDEMALSESLKLLFNVTTHYPHRVESFSKSISCTFKILGRIKIPPLPLQGTVSYLINGVLNLDLEDKKKFLGANPVFPKFDQNCNVDKLVEILDKAVDAYKEQELEQFAVPLVTLLRKVYEFSPDGPKKHMQELLLPTDEERERPLGESQSLSSKLLKLSTSPVAPSLREAISSIMFELSDKDADKFVKNIGFGFASGFLMNHNLPIPSSASQAYSNETQDSEDTPINPVTGQRVDREIPDDEPPMTEEEKEREAERLFVLFERLKATGVVDVKNPFKQAMDEGRFEELD